MSRRRGRKGLQVGPGERYALLPREVGESAPYNAQTDWSRTVLFALLPQYHGHNNGLLGLTFPEAKTLGVHAQWKLYAGLKLLCQSDLIVCTRRGRLQAGEKLPSLYAVTWKGIDEPKEGVVYDFGINVSPIPSHRWAKWQKPDHWQKLVKNIERVARGRRPKENPYTPRDVEAAPHVMCDVGNSRASREAKETHLSAHHVVVASKTSAGGNAVSMVAGTVDRAIAHLIAQHSHLLDGDIARACDTDAMRVASIRARLADGWTP